MKVIPHSALASTCVYPLSCECNTHMGGQEDMMWYYDTRNCFQCRGFPLLPARLTSSLFVYFFFFPAHMTLFVYLTYSCNVFMQRSENSI